ncbi:MAG TPA: class I SAM-dependent methyltransferase [Candidatus Acidoferrum sp.]|nr:class I SAM-dependent methyltransferase [Candidatus Acidoferrum sp.]
MTDSAQNATKQGIDPWEAAYLRFETPEEEIRKFTERLRRLGVSEWPRETTVVELFCGRGNGLHALARLGFRNIEGVDVSPRLLAEYTGEATCTAGDCRELPFADKSKDAAIVQGGLHHLPVLPDDLERVFAELRRVLRPEGRVVLVEPWLTPFLHFVHAVSQNPVARRLSVKLDALATMIENERHTYENWLGRPQEISQLARRYFQPEHESFARGKWNFVGRARA